MRIAIMIGSVLLPLGLIAQDSTVKKNVWAFSGYLKDMEWVRFDNKFRDAEATNLIHNRVNIRWSPNENWSGRFEVRNRFYYGDDVRTVPGFKEGLRNQNEAIKLSTTWWTNSKAVLHSNIERLWMEYKQPKWNIRAGRQRINWGITNTWNPNDLFNTYNFLDFDYEERAGTDAVKAQYLFTDVSNIELAVAGTGRKAIMAAKYYTNYRQYDLQWNAGVYQRRLTAGMGWAGSIKDAGFKGEVQYYGKKDSSDSQWLLVLEGDYIFRKGWYLSTAFLYNQKGFSHPLDGSTSLVFQASPLNLMPTKWNILINTTKDFTPRFSGSMNLVFAPGTNLLILFPMLRYNLKTNWDIDFVWQSFFAEKARFESISHTGFLRLRWSF